MECMDLGPISLRLVSQMLIICYRFQWAKLQIDQLLSLSCVSDIRDFLGKLPEDLERAYDEIISQINSEKGRIPEVARRAFLWMMCSRTPLKPGMLAYAACQDPETRVTNPIDININIVLEACRGLLIIDQSGLCRFSHLSVQEYLETRRYSNGQAHLVVGTVCLHMLLDSTNWQTLGSPRKDSEDPVGDDKTIFPYTIAYWPHHVRLHTEKYVDDHLRSLTKEFLGSPKEGSAQYMRWSHEFPKYSKEGFYLHLSKSSGPAFAVVFFSLNQTLYDWWTHNIDVDSQDDSGRSLLHIAGLVGNLTAAKGLLDLGANSNIQHKSDGNALYAAACGGSEGIASLLLDRGVDINAQCGIYGNALQAAAFQGSEAVVCLLLGRGASINAQGGQHGNALQAATFSGNKAIVHLLLDRGASINAQGGYYGNVLQAAAVIGNESTVHHLIDRGADINAQGGHYGNALQAAAKRGSEAIVHILLDRGADINAQGGYYGNALQAAVSSGSEAIAHLLLDRGVDINAHASPFGSALQAAVHWGKGEIASLLLDRGADTTRFKQHLGSCTGCQSLQGLNPLVKQLKLQTSVVELVL